jgi:ribosomal protein S27AE
MKPICKRCGTEGEIRYREPGVYYCPKLECPVGEISHEKITRTKTGDLCPRCGRDHLVRNADEDGWYWFTCGTCGFTSHSRQGEAIG